MFIGLTIIFGSIILVDTIKENSPKNKRAIALAEIRGQEIFQESMQIVNKNVDERMKLWKDSGLPPSMWK